MLDGGVSKVGTWIQLSGGFAGPDGLAVDVEGGVVVAHLGIGIWRFDRRGRPTHLAELPEDNYGTNVAFGGPDGRSLFITESATGCILRCEMPVAGHRMFSHA